MEHYGISVEPERRSTLPIWDSGYESRLIYSEDTSTLSYGSDVGWKLLFAPEVKRQEGGRYHVP